MLHESDIQVPWRSTIRRRYHADYTDYAWHVDFNCKLVEYRVYLHACVDGRSRMVLWNEVTTDTRPITTYPFFARVARQRGRPDQLVMDAGHENRLMALACYVSHYNIPEDRRPARAPVKVVSSTRNNRIERFWSEPNMRISRYAKKFFLFLEFHFERTGPEWLTFNPVNPIELGALHRVFLPAIRILVDSVTRTRNRRNVQATRNAPGTGGVPSKLVVQHPRPAEKHLAWEDWSLDDIIEMHREAGFSHALGEDDPRGKPGAPRRPVDPLASFPAFSAQRDAQVNAAMDDVQRADHLMRGGDGKTPQEVGHWVALADVYAMDLRLTYELAEVTLGIH